MKKRRMAGQREKERKRENGAQAPGSCFCIGHWVICIYFFSPHSISEKPSPRGYRHCWPNHVKYCVYCCVFSPSNLYLVGLSHPIGPLSCQSLLLRGSVRNSKFCVVTITFRKITTHFKVTVTVTFPIGLPLWLGFPNWNLSHFEAFFNYLTKPNFIQLCPKLL